MNRNSFNNLFQDAVSLAIIYIVVGILLAFFGSGILLWALRIGGAMLVAYGIFELYQYFKNSAQATMSAIILGVPAILVGLFLMISPGSIVSIFPIVVGVIILFNSVIQVQRALAAKNAGFPSWTVSLVLALILMGVALYLIFRPMGAVHMVFRLCGWFLIFEGAMMLFSSFQTRNL